MNVFNILDNDICLYLFIEDPMKILPCLPICPTSPRKPRIPLIPGCPGAPGNPGKPRSPVNNQLSTSELNDLRSSQSILCIWRISIV